MLNKEEFEEIFCVESLDLDNPINYRRKKYLLDFIGDIPPISDADLYTQLSKIIPADKNLDNYTIGIYTRLQLLSYFKRPFKEIYNYGTPQYIEMALNKLKKNGYIEFENLENLKIINL